MSRSSINWVHLRIQAASIMHPLVASVNSVFFCLIFIFLYHIAYQADAKLCEHTSIKSPLALHFLKCIKNSLLLSLGISPDLRP